MFLRFALQPGLLSLALVMMVVLSHISSFEIGRPAMMALFILTAYWLTRRWHSHQEKASGIIEYYRACAWRLWPLYAAAAFIVALLMIGGGLVTAQVSYLLNLIPLGMASRGNDLLGVAWALDMAVQFCLILPFLTRAISWTADGTVRRKIALACAGMMLTALGWVLLLKFNLWTVFAYLPIFALGMWLALTPFNTSPKLAKWSAGLFCLIGLAVALLPVTRALIFKDLPPPFPVDWFAMVWAATLVPVIAHTLACQRRHKLDPLMERLAYPLLLLHWPVIALGHEWFAASLGYFWKPVAVLLAFLIAYAAYALITKRIDAFRVRYFGVASSAQQQTA